ncbi:MBOAT family protein isoform 4 [Gossypium australe]|uniref:MBOAT family protein isoform 4 n=1 Tax=Gossypium australe TaxID=47621 RepID=A0A5B6UBE2_9ROSI|nr:MBOAT family protein isoform 4 [Gossypium australe]
MTGLFNLPFFFSFSQAKGALDGFIFRELRAAGGTITITCLMVANLVGYVIGPSGFSWLISQFLSKEGLNVFGFMLLTFYVGTKKLLEIMIEIHATYNFAHLSYLWCETFAYCLRIKNFCMKGQMIPLHTDTLQAAQLLEL